LIAWMGRDGEAREKWKGRKRERRLDRNSSTITSHFSDPQVLSSATLRPIQFTDHSNLAIELSNIKEVCLRLLRVTGIIKARPKHQVRDACRMPRITVSA
jgi:hypothetical protein